MEYNTNFYHRDHSAVTKDPSSGLSKEDIYHRDKRTIVNIARDVLHMVEFPANKNRVQRRNNGDVSPYVNHPIQGIDLIVRVGEVNHVAMLKAETLHDLATDTQTIFVEIDEVFESQASNLVAKIVHHKSLPKLQNKRLQKENTPCLLYTHPKYRDSPQ